MRLLLFFICITSFLHCKNQNFQYIDEKNQLTILSPSLSNQKRAKIRLKNGLEAYIISDSEASQSAAALSVESGAWNDPEQCDGMAHFCEHMLFMGSEKYPNENEFFQAVSDCSGVANAYTSSDRTVYMFSSNNNSFQNILDIFSNFFTNPLFKKDAIKRELLAVNQEYQKNIENDSWRENMIFKESGNQNHQNAKFSTGNENTLSKISIESLINWYKFFYSADKMHLSIYSNKSLKELVELVINLFNNIPTNNQRQPTPYAQLTSETQKGHITYIKPLKDIRQISMGWEMPTNIAEDTDARASYLIGYYLTSKCKNSLYEKLNKVNLAEDISYTCDSFDKKNMILTLVINLTNKGVSNLDEVIDTTFQCINSIKENGVPKYIFDEINKISTINYQWQSRIEPFNFVQQLANDMIDEPIDTFPYKSTVINLFKPELIKEALKQMTPQNCLFFVVASPTITGQIPDKKERWNGGEYKVVQIDKERLDTLLSINEISEIGEPNNFIPNELKLINHKNKDNKPTLIADEQFGKCFVLEDSFYLVPEIEVRLGIKSHVINDNTKNIVLTDLLTIQLQKKLATLISAANRANINVNIYQKNLKLNIAIGGYSNKVDILINKIIEGIKINSPSIEEFRLCIDQLSSCYEEMKCALPFFQSQYIMKSILFNNEKNDQQLCSTLLEITYEDFINYTQQFKEQIYVEGIISGNINTNNAKKMWENIKNQLYMTPYPKINHSKKTIIALNELTEPQRIELESPVKGNSTLLMLHLGENSFENIATHKILSKALSEAFFSTLRTKQQTGYMTKGWLLEENDELMFFFNVHSTTHYSQELLSRFELFIEEFNRDIEKNIPEERFSFLKNSTITSLIQPQQNLCKKTCEIENLAFIYNGNFSRDDSIIEALNNLSYKQFICSVQSSLSRQNGKRIAVLIDGAKSDNKSFSYRQTTINKAVEMERR